MGGEGEGVCLIGRRKEAGTGEREGFGIGGGGFALDILRWLPGDHHTLQRLMPLLFLTLHPQPQSLNPFDHHPLQRHIPRSSPPPAPYTPNPKSKPQTIKTLLVVTTPLGASSSSSSSSCSGTSSSPPLLLFLLLFSLFLLLCSLLLTYALAGRILQP